MCAYMMTGTAKEGYKGNGFSREDKFGKKKKHCDIFECSEYASELKGRVLLLFNNVDFRLSLLY